ncbi:MAG TPA: DSD1 family PLP-dependent enzyme [Ktedonobacteraceae bacterium]|nr:DSD1 family PLP-dependent enzyme [Ktedonobacteraceae bacterium]
MNQENRLYEYRSAIGKARHDLITPALILDLDVARRNITTMADYMRGMAAQLRPHIKVHKSPELARLQMEAGACIGVTTATVWEAVVMARGGINDILVANAVVGPEKISTIAELAREAHILVAIDDEQNAEDLSQAALKAGSVLGVLIDLDVGMGRCGARSKEEALRLARCVSRLRGLRFEGMMGYEGHCMLEPDPELRVRKARAAMDSLMETVDFLAQYGFESKIISGGGTGTYNITGAHPRLTELQAGSYVVMDAFHAQLIPAFPVALTVLGTVISRHGSRVILDSGRKAIGSELGLPRLKDVPSTTVGIAEEHLLVDVDAASSLTVGDRVEVVSGYGPTTVNLHDVYYVVERDVVTDVWPVQARAAGLGPYR